MKPILYSLLLSVFVCTNLSGQDYIGSKRNDIKEKIREQFNNKNYTIKFSDEVVKIDTIYGFGLSQAELNKKIIAFGKHYYDSLQKLPTVIENIDTAFKLRVSISGIEKIEIEYFFDGYPYYQSDSATAKFFCPKCANKHIKYMLKREDRKWKKINKNHYISRFKTIQTTHLQNPDPNLRKMVGSPQMLIDRSSNEFTSLTLCMPVLDQKTWSELTK